MMKFKFENLALSFVIVIALTFNSGEALKCYECFAVGSATDECDGDIVTKSDSKNVVECEISSMNSFHFKIEKNSVLSPISKVFAVDAPQSSVLQSKTPMSCVKLAMKVGSESAVIRTCQSARTENVEPCQVMRDKITKEHQSVRVESCDICEYEKCNGSDEIKSSTLFIIFIPLFASVLMGIIYQSA